MFVSLATDVGSTLAFFARRTNPRFLSTALGFSASVVSYVSMIEIVVRARDLLEPRPAGR